MNSLEGPLTVDKNLRNVLRSIGKRVTGEKTGGYHHIHTILSRCTKDNLVPLIPRRDRVDLRC